MTCWAVSVVRYEQIHAMSGCLEKNGCQRVALISALHILRKFAEARRSGIRTRQITLADRSSSLPPLPPKLTMSS
jgi:hypothetical protein